MSIRKWGNEEAICLQLERDRESKNPTLLFSSSLFLYLFSSPFLFPLMCSSTFKIHLSILSVPWQPVPQPSRDLVANCGALWWSSENTATQSLPSQCFSLMGDWDSIEPVSIEKGHMTPALEPPVSSKLHWVSGPSTWRGRIDWTFSQSGPRCSSACVYLWILDLSLVLSGKDVHQWMAFQKNKFESVH